MKYLLVVGALIIVGISLFVFLPLRGKQPKISWNTTPIGAPSINTVTLPDATIGVPYSGDIFTSILGSHENLKLSVSNLPEGLAIGSCTQKYDVPIIRVPNTIRDCPITGTPRSAGTFQIAVTGRITNGLVSSVTTIPLVVVGQ